MSSVGAVDTTDRASLCAPRDDRAALLGAGLNISVGAVDTNDREDGDTSLSSRPLPGQGLKSSVGAVDTQDRDDGDAASLLPSAGGCPWQSHRLWLSPDDTDDI